MNNTLHTWQISFGNIVDQNKKTICFLPERKNNDTAHLIAAAPDLLAILNEVCVQHDMGLNEIETSLYDIAKTAIRKAKGEA
jgi:hypothetical protein